MESVAFSSEKFVTFFFCSGKDDLLPQCDGSTVVKCVSPEDFRESSDSGKTNYP